MSSQPQTKPIEKKPFLPIVKSMQFAWFVGHASTLLFTCFYLLTYSSKSKLNSFFYRLIYLSVIESFGIILYQSFKSNVLKLNNINGLLQDDNVHYISIAACFLLILPKITVSLLPFDLFSFFHFLTYINSTLLPFAISNYPAQASLLKNVSDKLGFFIKNYNEMSMYYASNFEILVFFYILTRAILFTKGFWIAFVIYSVFMKLRFEKSIFTRNCFKKLEVRLDGVFSNNAVSPQIKQFWVNFKHNVKVYGNKIQLINNNTTTTDDATKKQ